MRAVYGTSLNYRSLHYWVQRNLGKPSKCENCGNTNASRYHWANISGEYKRDLTDWARLCPSCHALLDNQAPKHGAGIPRISFCVRGHEYTISNTYKPPHAPRECRACRRERQRD